MSHSHGLALYAIACECELGVDLEYIQPIADVEQIVDRFFSDQEKTAFQALLPERELETFFMAWTRKEAYLKATGAGLRQPLDTFSVSLASGEMITSLEVDGNPLEAVRWSLHPLVPADGYVGALVVEGHMRDVSRWRWAA